MARVFLSYDRDDAAKAGLIAAELEKAGHSVWWDRHIKGGAQYSKEIDNALKEADAVVVLWSEGSVDSAWVRDEAAAGRDGGRLVPIRLDDIDPPLGFRQYQTIDLSHWRGHGRPPHMQTVLEAVDSLGDKDAVFAAGKPVRKSALADRARGGLRLNWWLIIGLLAVLLGLAIARPWEVQASTPIVAVTPVQGSAESDALARALLVKLGSLRAAKTDALLLVGADGRELGRADLVFEAASGSNPKDLNASLTLLAGSGRAVLWSKDFEASGDNRTALEQSMAYTAGQVLECALQAKAPSHSSLDEQTFKLFLNGCALFGERYRSDPESVVPIFSQVVAVAPKFEPAWSKLLLAEAQNLRGQILFYDRWAPGNLPEHIREARKLNPQLPELHIAEAALLPIHNLEERLRLLDEAVRLSPDNPDLRVARAEFLSFIGRNSESIIDARRAAEINPLSPGFRSNLVQALVYAGQLTVAEQELRRAEQLWPGSPTIDDARFRLNSRYGDPRDALRMVQSPDFKQYYSTEDMVPYLEARMDPTDANVQRAITASQGPHLAPSRRLVQTLQLLAEFNRVDQAYELLSDLSPEKLRLASGVIFRPPFENFRQDRRFMPLAQRASLIDFWRHSGKWPDFCFEPDMPYDCKAEAAKLS